MVYGSRSISPQALASPSGADDDEKANRIDWGLCRARGIYGHGKTDWMVTVIIMISSCGSGLVRVQSVIRKHP